MADETTQTVTAPATETPATTSETPTAPVTPEPKEIDPTTLKADEIKDLINNPPKLDQTNPDGTPAVKEEWFDKEHGFKTKEDMIKSYTEAQNKIRETSEQIKQFENFKNEAEVQLQELSKKAASAPLSPEDAQKKQAIEKWQSENQESLEMIANIVEQKVKAKQVNENIKTAALTERNNWKSEFDKDEARKTLWPKMEEIYAKKGDKIFQEFIQNPFPYLEAVAFKENFGMIAEKIKQEAVEQYKAQQLQAAEVAKSKSTAIPGGVKSISGQVDVSKLSSSELAAMLPRAD